MGWARDTIGRVPFLLLVVVIVLLGVIAAVAAGRGDGLVPESAAAAHDRSPLALPPPGQPLGAAELGELRFALAVRGYRVDEVDLVMARVGAELAERDARIAHLAAALAERDRTPGGD